MSDYVVSSVRLDKSGNRVTHVLWALLDSPLPKDYYSSEATVLHVVDALKRGDRVHVHLTIDVNMHSTTPGLEFKVVVYAGGSEGIELPTSMNIKLVDLPSF